MSESKKVRLNKVLQKLNISLELAVEFLHSNGHEIKKRPTTKVSSKQYSLLFKEFNSDKSDEFKTNEEVKKGFNKREKRIYDKLSKAKKISYRFKKLKKRNKKQKTQQLVKGENIESQGIKRIKHTTEHYRLLKLKRTFLNKDYNLIELCDYYFIKESWVLSQLLKHFPDVKMSDKVTQQHLIYISENLYETLCEVKKYSETIDSKNPKTKPNYYKLIYTR